MHGQIKVQLRRGSRFDVRELNSYFRPPQNVQLLFIYLEYAKSYGSVEYRNLSIRRIRAPASV